MTIKLSQTVKSNIDPLETNDMRFIDTHTLHMSPSLVFQSNELQTEPHNCMFYQNIY
jgi:hypothetical protein